MKTDDIIRLKNIIDSHSIETISRKLQEIVVNIRSERNVSATEVLKNEQHLYTLAKAFKIAENSESIGTATAILEKMAYWFSELTTLDNYRALTLQCFNLYFQENITNNGIDASSIIILGKAFNAEPIKYAGYLFWLLENNVDLTEIDDSRITQQFFAYHAFDLDVIKKTYQLFENISAETTAFLYYFNEISSQMRGFINSKLQDNVFSSYNVLGTQYNHPQEQIFYHSNLPPSLDALVFCGYITDKMLPLYALFDWTLIECLDFEIYPHQLVIEQILRHRHAERFLISFSERALTGEVSYSNALFLLEKIKTFWIGNNFLEDDLKINLLTNYPFLIHSLVGNINLSTLLELKLETFQQQAYLTLTHLPFLCRLYVNIPESLIYRQKYKNILINFIFNIISQHGNTISNDSLRHIQPIPLKSLFCEFLLAHHQTLTQAIEQFLSDQVDFETIENVWGSQLSMVNLAVHLFPEFKDDIYLPYSKYDLYLMFIDKIAALEPLLSLHKFQQFLSLFQDRVGLSRVILQEALVRTKIHSTRHLIVRHVGIDEGFADLITQPMLNKKSIVDYAVELFHCDLIIFILTVAENTTLLDKIQNMVVGSFREIIDPFDNVLKDTNSQNRRLITFLLPRLKNNEQFIELIKSLLLEAINQSYNSFITFLLSKEHVSFLTTEFLSDALLKKGVKESSMVSAVKETVLLLCGMKLQTLHASGLIVENNLALFFSVIKQFIGRVELFNAYLEVHDDRKNNILHMAATYRDFENLKIIFQVLEEKEEPDEIFKMLKEKNWDDNIPHAPGDDAIAREINAFLKRQYDRYEELYLQSFGQPRSPSLPNSASNENAFFQGNRKRRREEVRSVDSQASTVSVDDEITNDSDSDFQAETWNILNLF